ncbi:hypothetical protein C2S53_004279 [Perilla frutescens var. hirtella]|uniref:Glycosyltransferase n=1 Tax=Perilla frutescens var. hirtella TaxID=608512 RepID=A0AAD4NXL5_PERFH|nr:hypothetical protein C2S53_004279 [Perilla frutescens var. hirtella]
MEKEKCEFRILMFPWLSYSHVHPFLELAKNLTKKGFHIYICSSPINLDSIRKKIENSSSIDLIELHVPSLPELPPHLHTTKNLPPNLWPILCHAFQQTSSSFSEILNNLSPDLLVYDFFQPWAAKQALSQGIQSIYFATAGAAPFSYFYHLFKYGAGLAYPYEEIYLHDHEKVDPTAPVKLVVKDADEESFSFGVFDLSCDIVLIKGLRGFDGKYIDYLSKLCKKRVVPTGPLVQESSDHVDEKSLEILSWLSKRGPLSTVFICFGSEHFISMEQILEIARGLELCKSSFVWVVRLPAEAGERVETALPGGFLERVRERGLVVEGWASQAKILSHHSIGGFVSHCGWSSIMESLYVGVPVIAMPIKHDQPINARIVTNAGVGVEVVRGGKGRFAAEEVARAINEVIDEKNGEGIRERAKELSEKMKKEEGAAVDEIAEQILLLCKKSRQQSLMDSLKD